MELVKLAAVGDISFEGMNAHKPDKAVFSAVANQLKQADVGFGNLENPLIEKGEPIQGKCTLHGHTGWAKVIKDSGFTIMSLANNHLMDYGPEGLSSTITSLRNAGIYYVGAGINENNALAPLVIEINKCKIAFIARSSVEVSSKCYAKDNSPGVAYFDLNETLRTIQHIKKQVDYIILSIHWGIEEYSYPTVEQRELAKELISSDVNLIIGHHPHVLQGYERIKNGLVFYSLGNFLFGEFDWEYKHADGNIAKYYIKLSEKNRIGRLVNFSLADNKLDIRDRVDTYIDPDQSHITISDNSKNKVAIDRLNIFFSIPLYKLFWIFYSIAKEWQLRIGTQFSLVKVLKGYKKIRFIHVKRLIVMITRSMLIVFGKKTNPYE